MAVEFWIVQGPMYKFCTRPMPMKSVAAAPLLARKLGVALLCGRADSGNLLQLRHQNCVTSNKAGIAAAGFGIANQRRPV